MKLLKNIRFKYYWGKAEEALKKGNYDEADMYKQKMNEIRGLKLNKEKV